MQSGSGGVIIGKAHIKGRGLSALFLSALCFLVLCWPALGAPPNHLPGSREITGLNHACGTAVDSQGNVYVSSAGDSQIRVFDSDLDPLATIANPNAPCGLAVNSRGRLFASETATGTVVRYKPTTYPFVGPPSYGAREVIDEGHDAQGIAVDALDDRLYVAEGTRIHSYSGRDEVQRIIIEENVTSGTYTLTFEGTVADPVAAETTGELDFGATAAEIEAALVALASIDPGDVIVKEVTETDGGGVPSGFWRDVSFTGKYEAADILPLEIDSSKLVGGGGGFVLTRTDAWAAPILEGELSEASGVAAYTYAARAPFSADDHYLFAADEAGDEVKIFNGPDAKTLEPRKTVEGVDHDRDPLTPDQEFGFGAAGAYLAVDPGNGTADGKCTEVGAQACTAGHLLLYDAAHEAVDELEATGEFLDQLPGAIADAEPTAMAVERSGGAHDGTIYVTTGAGAGAKLLSFGPLAAPSRAPLFELTEKLNNGDGAPSEEERLKSARSVATDAAGNVYVTTGALIQVFAPDGTRLAVGLGGSGIADPNEPVDLAVDSEGNVYVLDTFDAGFGDDDVYYYSPSSPVPADGTTYARNGPLDISELGGTPDAIAVNPENDHLLVTGTSSGKSATIELDAAASGSGFIRQVPSAVNFGSHPPSIDVYGADGSLYASEEGKGRIWAVDAGDTGRRLAGITGAGCAAGPKKGSLAIAVDQSNGHVLAFDNFLRAGREYDASGACVAEFFFPEPQGFTENLFRSFDIAIDNSDGPGAGNVYIAFDDAKANTPDLWAFAPLNYGDVPAVKTLTPTGLGAGNATFNGTVTPRDPLVQCGFEFLPDSLYEENVEEGDPPFQGAIFVPCAESLASIGAGEVPIAVHADVAGLDPEKRYRVRLAAANKYGPSEPEPGEPVLFGPPLLEAKAALPVLFDEATLRAGLDPSGLPTEYRFEYGTQPGVYDQSTPPQLLAGGAMALVEAPLTGLAEDTVYYFRPVASNEAKQDVAGEERQFRTQKRGGTPPCPNEEYRFGLSAQLPDCRAYELITPPETNGLSPAANAEVDPGTNFNNWLAMPRGPGAGEQIAYFTVGTLPGFEGNGALDGYLARRDPDPGDHPAAGWRSELFGPSYAQAAPDFSHNTRQPGVSSDQLFSFWSINPAASFPETLAPGIHLRTPAGFEVAGQGPLGEDPQAQSRYVSAGGSHVIFVSKAHLHADAPAAGIAAVYDRPANSNAAEVVSLLPGDLTPSGAAAYLATTEDGAAILFKLDEVLYLRRGAQTTEIAEAPNTFAGISEDGSRVFYASAGELHAFDVDGELDTAIAPNSAFVHVSADGSRAFFASQDAIPGTSANENGELAEDGVDNLYAWDADGNAVSFVSHLHPDDFDGFANNVSITIDAWTKAINPGQVIGRTNSPTRSTPDGGIFVFQSHAQLTAYDNEGEGEVYRYDPAAGPGEQLLCPSCDPSGAPPSGDAMLGSASFDGEVAATTLILSLADDGAAVFFQSPDRLLPADANAVQDVYEWRAPGSDSYATGACEGEGGCLSLISSGQGEANSYLYGMSADGRDVFIRTSERLVGADIPGSPSIYDARVGGGIPEPPPQEPCQGDACQPLGSGPPALPSPASTGPGTGDPPPGKKGCPRGKHKVKAKGKKARCAKKGAKRGGRRASAGRGGRR